MNDYSSSAHAVLIAATLSMMCAACSGSGGACAECLAEKCSDLIELDCDGDADCEALWSFAQVYPVDEQVSPTADVLLDTEWKLRSDGRLAVKQVRPFLD